MSLKDMFSKIDDSFTVHIYENGYMLEVGGRDPDEGWVRKKIICLTQEDLFAKIQELNLIEKD